MTRIPEGHLARECQRFCHYLLGCDAPPSLVTAYHAAHRSMPAHPDPPDALDRVLLWMGHQGGVLLRVADGYARLGRSDALLRHKLALVLALLETNRDTYRAIDIGIEGRVRAVSTAVWSGTVAVSWMILGVVLVGPLHIVLRVTRSLARG